MASGRGASITPRPAWEHPPEPLHLLPEPPRLLSEHRPPPGSPPGSPPRLASRDQPRAKGCPSPSAGQGRQPKPRQHHKHMYTTISGACAYLFANSIRRRTSMRPGDNRHDRVIRNAQPLDTMNPEIRAHDTAQLLRPQRRRPDEVSIAGADPSLDPRNDILIALHINARRYLHRRKRLLHRIRLHEPPRQLHELARDIRVNGVTERPPVNHRLQVPPTLPVVLGRQVNRAARRGLDEDDARAAPAGDEPLELGGAVRGEHLGHGLHLLRVARHDGPMGVGGEELGGVLGEVGLDDLRGAVGDEGEGEEGAAVDVGGVRARLVLCPLGVCLCDELGVAEEGAGVGGEVRGDFFPVLAVVRFLLA